MKKILIISPHPDDETLGCGGTILKNIKNGHQVHWLNMTTMKKSDGFSKKKIDLRAKEIKKVIKLYNFKTYKSFNFSTAKLDVYPLKDIIKELNNVIRKIKPETIYIPSIYDNHTDHKITHEAVKSCFKWFRQKSVKKVLTYEVLSETNISFNRKKQFLPNVYENISNFLNKKINIMKIYSSEISKHPFPRSKRAIISLAVLRGTQSGFKYAEAFELLIDRSS
tara:strand:+ start:301 stop:969 length:669 start_codon:yes stop_codon:yes gene_type:complete